MARELNFTFKMPDDETLAKYISIKGEKGDRGDPTKLSQLENDTNFVSKNTTELDNYYTKTETDNRITAAVNELDEELGVPDGFFTDSSETVSGQGQTITLNGTANAIFKEIKLYGDTEQDGTPTPDSPVGIEVVTGDQTITITDGDQQSQSYTLSLGDLGLCKIGDYRDYIHKTNGKWFLHKEIARITLDGSEANAFTYQASRNGVVYNVVNNPLADHANAPMVGLCDHFSVEPTTTTWTADNTMGMSSTGALWFEASFIGSAADWTDWLSENPTTIYYALADAVEEEIADSTLISQLETLCNYAKSYKDTTILTASGSLSAILFVEAFRGNWNGTISGINDELDDRYTKSEIESILNDKVQFIFQKAWANAGNGDCELIKYRNKNILIDCHNTTVWTEIKAMLDNYNVSHIDYFVISHYHPDHYGNYRKLVENGYVNADTEVLLPAYVTTFGQDYIHTYTAIKSYYDNAGINYRVPAENEVMLIEDKLKLTFVNCDKDILDTYVEKSQNDCSTCVLVEYGKTKAFFGGDASKQAYARLREANFPNSSINLFKCSHHGGDSNIDVEYIRQLSPEYAVQTASLKAFTTNSIGLCGELVALRELNAKTYPCYMQNDYIVFESDGSEVQCLKGRPYGSPKHILRATYYVDRNASTSEIQDGSEDHPFSELMQAILSIPLMNDMEVTISLADGYYGGSVTDTSSYVNRIIADTGQNIRISIVGNSSDRSAVILNGVLARRSNVVLRDLTIDVDNWNGIEAYNSFIETRNVVIKSNTDTISTTNNGVLLRENAALVTASEGLRIEQCDYGIFLDTGASFVAGAPVVIGSTNSGAVIDGIGTTLYTGTQFSFDNASEAISAKYYLRPFSPVSILASHTDYATSLQVVRAFSDFDWVEIYYRTSHNRYFSTGRIYSPNNKYIELFGSFTSSPNPTFSQARVRLLGTSLAIEQQKETVCNADSNTITSESNLFDIVKVIGGFKDYVDINS